MRTLLDWLNSPLVTIASGAAAILAALLCLLQFHSGYIFPFLGAGLVYFVVGCVRLIVARRRIRRSGQSPAKITDGMI